MIANLMNSVEKPDFGLLPYVQYLREGYYALWFLPALMWMILLAPILYLLLKRRKYYWPEPALILLLLIGLNKISIPKVGFNIYYVLGAYLGMNFTELVNKDNRKVSVIAAMAQTALAAPEWRKRITMEGIEVEMEHESKKQHILVVSQYFYPENFRINDICREWVKRGYEVTVVTGIPNYPQGAFYEGYDWFKKRKEELEGIHVIRIPLIARGKNPVMLVLNYFSFVISGFFWKLFTKVKADKVFIFEVSPMTQALVGVWYAKKRKIPCYLYVQDLWPENVEIVTGIHNQKILHAIDKMVDYIYKNCKKIFATSPSFVKRLEERSSVYQQGESKVIYWPQYAEEFYQPVEKEPLPDVKEDDSFKIVFTGNIGFAQGLDILPKTAGLLKAQGVNCCFYIIGDGRYRDKLEQEIKEQKVEDMFSLLGRKAPEEIPQYMAHCDAAFLSFADNPLFEMTIPAKLQSYMACGMPIIAAAKGETGRIINEAECGVYCKLGSEQELAQAVMEMIKIPKAKITEMGKNALMFYSEWFQKKKLMDQVCHIMDEQ